VLCGFSIVPIFEKYIDNIAVLINGSPQTMRFPLDLHEDFIKEEHIAISPMSTLQPFREE
jgi:hypothetical protein|tara:strand:+ start:532 stop:711 length:180 start_codon:yes stop_codon:yes gene_type:complete